MMFPLHADYATPMSYRKWPTVLSNHARVRLGERTKMTELALTTVLDRDWAMPLAYHPGTERWHRLIYSPADAEHFAAVQAMDCGEVMTVLPLSFYDQRNFYISEEKLDRARNKVMKGLDIYRRRIAVAAGGAWRAKRYEVRGHFVDPALNLKTESFGKYSFHQEPATAEEALDEEPFMKMARGAANQYREGRWVLYEVELAHASLPKPWSLAWEELESWQLPYPPPGEEQDEAPLAPGAERGSESD